jgi:hypothetical protein
MTGNAFADYRALGYLRQYFEIVDGENSELLAFHARAQSMIPAGGRMLEFGGGPTIYQLISAAGRRREIHFVDYLEDNLAEIRRWLGAQPGRHDWAPFTLRALEHEGAGGTVDDRHALIRSAVVRLGHCDALADRQIEWAGTYDLVAVNFVLESITTDRDLWRQALARMLDLITPGGHLLMTALTGSASWRIGELDFPSTRLSAADIRHQIAACGMTLLLDEAVQPNFPDPNDPTFTGYTGIYMAVARLDAAPADSPSSATP